jgi:hypothetical protein
MRAIATALLALGLVFAGPVGCGPTGTEEVGDGGPHNDTPSGPCTAGQKQCQYGGALEQCVDGQWQTISQCPAACDPTLGCVQCVPNGTMCQGQNVVACTPQGTPGAVVATCQGSCQNGACNDPCGQAEANKSYLGCDYWPTVTMNSQLNVAAGFSFAVAVANAGTSDADITVTGGALTGAQTATIAPGALQTIKLPWVPQLRQQFTGGAQTEKSVLMPNGAYHLQSTQPVTVYQFNALEYKIPTTLSCNDPSCDIASGIDGCEANVCTKYSYSNDASLLLPRHVLGDSTGGSNYLVIARPTMEIYANQLGRQNMWSPGFFAVVGTRDGTQVTVNFTANTIAGGSSALQAYAPGSQASFTVDAGTVLLVASGHNDACTGPADASGYNYCDLSQGYDLTGTEITSDKPIAVFGGHNCTFVPYNKWACDHLEEQLFPVTAWGKHYVATRAISTSDPNLWRVISSKDGNSIEFNPASVHAPVTLNKGEWLEFVTADDFEVTGSEALMVAGFMVGQNYSNANPGQGAPGDPSMTLGVPTEQYRSEYVFLAPETYTQNYVNIVAKTGASVLLDGNQITSWTPVGSGEWSVAKQSIQGGTHTIQTSGADGFGIQVYGVGSYTSYMYPGGLDVKQINVPG